MEVLFQREVCQVLLRGMWQAVGAWGLGRLVCARGLGAVVWTWCLV